MKAAMLAALPIFLKGCGAKCSTPTVVKSGMATSSTLSLNSLFGYPTIGRQLWPRYYSLTIIILVALTPSDQDDDSQSKWLKSNLKLKNWKNNFLTEIVRPWKPSSRLNRIWWKERGVNQFAGCLPLLIQLPVMFLALYQVIRTEVLRMATSSG